MSSAAAFRTGLSTPLAAARNGEERLRGSIPTRCATAHTRGRCHDGGWVAKDAMNSHSARRSRSTLGRPRNPNDACCVSSASSSRGHWSPRQQRRFASHVRSAAPEKVSGDFDVEERGGDGDAALLAEEGGAAATAAPPPLLVFVNGRSGGRRGERLTEALARRADLSPLEVVDLTRTGPRAALARFVGRVPGLRVLVCGGDGTVAWVLQALQDLKEVRACRTSMPRDLATHQDKK